MFESVEISPSILSADFLNMERDIRDICEAGAAYVHVDVMDGHFVPNLTMGVPLVRALAAARAAGSDRFSRAHLDVHLMVDNPLAELPWFMSVGMEEGDICSVHAETLDDAGMLKAIGAIHDAGVGACVALKPHTPVSALEGVIDKLDMVLVMSVEPGFSGQSYIEGSEDKVAEVVQLARSKGCSPLIQVDGGINARTAALVAQAGADVLVCGNAVFGAPNPAEALKAIQQSADEARVSALEGQVR